MKLTAKIAVRMFNALESLQGRTRVIETEGKATNAVFEAFSFPTQTRANIIRDLQLLRPIKEAVDEHRKSVVREISPDGSTQAIDNSPQLLVAYNLKVDEINAVVHDIKGLLYVNWSDLDVAKVPASVVENLGVLVRGMPKFDDADLVPEPQETPASA